MANEGAFLHVMSQYYLEHEVVDSNLTYGSFMATSTTAMTNVGNLPTLRRNSTLYDHMFKVFKILVPEKVPNASIHHFIKQIRLIIRNKQWEGIFCSTRNDHVDKIWNMLTKSRTIHALMVQSLLKAGKLWEGINLVYVWTLKAYHSHPLAIYNWALRLALDLA